MKKRSIGFWIFMLLLVGHSNTAFSQNVGINTAGIAPNSAAVLDIDGTPNNNQGLLIPRMTDAQRKALASPATGLLIFNTTTNTPNFYNGSGWQTLDTNGVSSSTSVGTSSGLGIAINTTGSPANNSALLDISSTTKGMLIPRTVPGSVTAITGLIIYNTGTNTLNYYNGSIWLSPCTSLVDNTTGSGATVGGVAINTTGASPNASAIVDVQSSSAGILIPRLTSIQRDAFPSPAIGIFIYNTTDQAIEYWTGTRWEELSLPVSGVSVSSTANPICTGTTLSLTGNATGQTTWAWTGPNGFTSNLQNPTISNFPITDTGTYILTASNGCGSATPVSTNNVKTTTSFIPITLTNNQASATVANFQQMITVNSSTYSYAESSGLQNVEFSTGPRATGTILQAWIESGATNTSTSTVYWVNLGSNTIAASGGTLTIYMNFMTTNIMSSTGPTGEAPQLSGTYAQYDNGALLFPFYDNFNGTSLNAANNWFVSGITYTVNNGFTATATAVDGFIVSKNVAINPATNIIDFYGNVFVNSSSQYWVAVGASDGGETGGTTGYGDGDVIVGSYPSGSAVQAWQRAGPIPALSNSPSMQSVSANAVWTITPLSTTTSSFYINYGGIQTITTNADSYPLYEGLVAAGAANATYTFNNPVTITWYRVRLYPPANVMPAVTFGAITCP